MIQPTSYLTPKEEYDFREFYESLGANDKRLLYERYRHAPKVGPMPGPQSMAYSSKADILGYGGSPGGGKSGLLAIRSFTVHRKSVIFRAEKRQLDGVMNDLVVFAGTDIGLNRNHGVFRLVSGYDEYRRPIPRIIEFGGLCDPGDENTWRGRDHDGKMFDECTELEQAKVLFLRQWNRSVTPGQLIQTLMTFNPPLPTDNVDSTWLIEFFAPWLDDHHPNQARPGELRYFYRDSNDNDVEASTNDPVVIQVGGKDFDVVPHSRTFIPAKVDDNSYLMKTNYKQVLLEAKEPQRSIYLLGLFRKSFGDHERQVLPSAWVDAAMENRNYSGRAEVMDAIGIDVARGGHCNTVLCPRHGWWYEDLIRKPGTETPKGQHVVALAVALRKDEADFCIDAGGPGSSPTDLLSENYPTFPIIGQRKRGLVKIEKYKKMYNLRSLLYWFMRKVLDPENGLMPSLPKDKRLRTELIAPRYKESSGMIQVEQKEELVKRLGWSPDDADAVVNSNYSALVRGDAPNLHRVSFAHMVGGFHEEEDLVGVDTGPGRTMAFTKPPKKWRPESWMVE